jgi:sulfatase maturation enzyme AslB (radical SAM superfamily)
MTNERWLRWAIARHFRQKGYIVNMKGVRVGNAIIDGEVIGDKWRMALEIKSGHDDAIRGIGQLAEAISHGYTSAALVVSLRQARLMDSAVFNRLNIVLLGVNSKVQVHQVYPR